MCGIAGQARRDGSVEHELIGRMCAAIAHRGPDSCGIFVDDGVGLGIQRLRVIDLHTGDQPIFNEDRSVAVVLNGEIYNFQTLRAQLVRAGHRFRTQGDTEVLVHLYEEHGPDFVKMLHGMFAFALWDAREELLMLARDRVGKKPLFYSLRGDTLSFASGLQGLLQDREIPRELDHQALDCYYAYQYVPAPLSAFKAVRKLPPASILLFSGGRARVERYWRLRYTPKRELREPAVLLEEIRAGVDAAVKRRMLADVPLGAFLSGGIDSSAVVASMAKHSHGPVKTFSIGFEHARFNELEHARTVAQKFSTEHHEFVVEPSAIEILPKIVRHYGEPFADASAIPSFYLAELTRRYVTVALNGDGGDESFAGYNRYVINALAHRGTRVLPPALKHAIATAARRVPPTSDPQSVSARIRRAGSAMSLSSPERYARYMSYFDADERRDLYTPEYSELIGESLAPAVIADPWRQASGSSVVDVMLETDVETYLPGDLLVKMDIATMAHSLEARSPLLDHELMELAASIPADQKLRGLEKKVVFRQALSAWLPQQLLDRPKMGFGVPIANWFRDELRGHVQDVLLDPATVSRGYFARAYVEQMLASHFDGREDRSPQIWALLMSELWHREYVDHAPAVVAAGVVG